MMVCVGTIKALSWTSRVVISIASVHIAQRRTRSPKYPSGAHRCSIATSEEAASSEKECGQIDRVTKLSLGDEEMRKGEPLLNP